MTNDPKDLAKLKIVADETTANEIARLRQKLLVPLAGETSLEAFCESLIEYLKPRLHLDRIYICDTKDGAICAGWMKGRNMIRQSDWETGRCPLDLDDTLQKALESDESVMNPVPGEGADLAVAIRFPNRAPWLMVFDETSVARKFSGRDLIYVYLARDLILLKARL